ncbi:MAG: right-handed parallel beta-helix repeat-containing protein [Thermoanaerobaculia bacterium]|nr:right-handed parallel beta-helix repeat-containing protein [Thermoanaerobaculia bacterium]
MRHRRGSAFGIGLAAWFAVVPALPAAKAALPKVVDVDCGKGASVQAAIKASSEPVEIVVHGFCAEHVVVDRADVTLRGASGDPELDGFTGLMPDGTAVDLAGDLALVHVEGVQTKSAKAPPLPETLAVHFRDLGVRDSPAGGIFVGEAGLGMTRVRVVSSAGAGVYFTSTSFGVLHELHASDNGGIGLRANRESLVNCGSCTISDNGNWAVVGSNGGKVALYDAPGGGPTVLSGPRGVQAYYGGRVWLYPGTDVVATSGQALWAVQSGAIEIYGAAIDGAVWCGIQSELYSTGLEQRSNGGINNFYTQCSLQLEDGATDLVGTSLFHAGAVGVIFGGSASFDQLACQAGGEFHCNETPGTVTKAASTCGGCP